VRTNDEKNFEERVKKGLEIVKKEAIKTEKIKNMVVKSVENRRGERGVVRS
jgi:hypothetical protein